MRVHPEMISRQDPASYPEMRIFLPTLRPLSALAPHRPGGEYQGPVEFHGQGFCPLPRLDLDPDPLPEYIPPT